MKISKLPFDYARVERDLLAFVSCRHGNRVLGTWRNRMEKTIGRGMRPVFAVAR